MQIYHGKIVSSGMAKGPIQIYKKNTSAVVSASGKSVEAELLRFQNAVAIADRQLDELYEKTKREVGEQEAFLFHVHRMLLSDPGFSDNVKQFIQEQKMDALQAVKTAGDNVISRFSAMEQDRVKSKVADLQDVFQRVFDILRGEKGNSISLNDPVVLFAHAITPSELIQLDRKHILALVTTEGSEYSHTAILAKAMSIPYIIGVEFSREQAEGNIAVVDAIHGVAYIDPEEEICEQCLRYKEKAVQETDLAPGGTVEQNLQVYANVSGVADLPQVLKNGAAGIGLFRSEFLYLGRNNPPTEEEQYEIYKTVLVTMGDKPVIIRTFDLGADKVCDYLNIDGSHKEAYDGRGIKLSLARPDLFMTQLRALLRASVYGNLLIMYPLVSALDELKQAKELFLEAEKQLEQEGVQTGNPKQGIMIETPEAVELSKELAKMADFFSIGSNDLTHYALGINRLASEVENSFDPHHPLILSMIRRVVENAHGEGITVGICGELAADTDLTGIFLEMGMDELSVSPDFIPSLCKIITNCV